MNIFAVKEVVDFPSTPVLVSAAPSAPLSMEKMQMEEAAACNLPARIIVIGVGGGGSNAVNRMIEDGLTGVEFVTVNTDSQDLRNKSRAAVKIQIGAKLTGGRGAGGKPEVGESAAKEDMEELAALVRGADMVFVTAGMGGGTGTGGAPVIARLAKEQGVLTIGVVTMPFDYEGKVKKYLADEGRKKMHASVDTLVVIPNQQIFKIADRKTTVPQAYQLADGILRQGVQGITDLIVKTGILNTDFADVKATMEGQGDALMGIGIAGGDDRAEKAAAHAIDNPLLEDTCIDGATRLLVNISGSENIAMVEVDEIMTHIKAKADPDVEIIHGIIIDPELGDNIKVTVIATGFKGTDESAVSKQDSSGRSEQPVISADVFDRYRGLGDRSRSNDSYFGMSSSPKNNFTEQDLTVPAYLRRNGSEMDVDKTRSAAGAKDA
jgi:cell division protein FtsZ